jgi:P27 family predicted phage terminase small subunit
MILKSKIVKMPSGLGVSRKLWREVTSEYIDFEPHHLKLLQLICETWDAIIEAREVLKKEGSYFVDRYQQPKEHPAADAERKNKTLFMRLVRELGLDIAPPSEMGRGKRRY